MTNFKILLCLGNDTREVLADSIKVQSDGVADGEWVELYPRRGEIMLNAKGRLNIQPRAEGRARVWSSPL